MAYSDGMTPTPYCPRASCRTLEVEVRGWRYRVLQWGEASALGTEPPPLVLLHGWMDVGASFQFLVDELQALEGAARRVLAPDWRGFGLTRGPVQDSYWFPDYLGDLDGLLDALCPGQAVDLLGHSMGGNVAMSYAGLRPSRIRRLVNLEGFGLPRTKPQDAPARLVQWLDSLKTPASLPVYDDLPAVAARLMKTNPRLPADRAHWLARQWASPLDDGRWRLLGDPAHKRPNPVLYQADEALALWASIQAPLLWVEAEATEAEAWWRGRYTLAEFHQRLSVVPKVRREVLAGCGHMLHHDQPAALAALLAGFLGG